MQTRTITVDYARPRGYDIGYRAENNFTLLALPIPAELEGADSYRVYFESTVGEYLQTEPLTPADGYVTVKITSDVVPEPGNMAAQLVAFADGEIVGYAPMITGSAKVSIPDGTERLSHSLAAEIALNTAARHLHSNKAVLDKFAESDGKPTYDGKALGGGGASDFIIKMTVEDDGNGNYTVISCDATVEQIDAAVADEKRVVVIASYGGIIFELPMLQGIEGNAYYFGMFLEGQMITSSVEKIGGNTSKWNFYATLIKARDIDYSNAALPNISTVKGVLDELVPKSHTHSNKAVLDKFAESDGKPTYDGKALGGGGASDFIIKMTVEGDDDGNYTVTSCDATVEQIDAAVAAEKRVVVIASSYNSGFYELPMFWGAKGNTYYFGIFQEGYIMTASVATYGSTSEWQLSVTPIGAVNVNYSNTALPSVTDVKGALDELVPNSHTHTNKDTLDKLSVSNGKLQYNGSDIGLKPSQITSGTNIILADNTEYRLTNVTTLNLTYPTDNFECWMRLTFAASGNATVTLPTGTKYIGTTPDFKNGETWELSFKDKVLAAQKVGDGT